MDATVLVASGHARELLTQLRRNSRFSEWGASFSSSKEGKPLSPLVQSGRLRKGLHPTEHRFVQDLKHVRRAPGHSNLLLMLQPFLEIIQSPEANGVITSAALRAVVDILGSVQEISEVHKVVGNVVEAVHSCRFEPTDASVDELVLSRIVEVLSVTVTAENSPVLFDEIILAAFETCFRLSTIKRATALLVSAATRELSSIVAAAVKSQVLESNNSSLHLPADYFRKRLRSKGNATFDFERDKLNQERSCSSYPLRAMLLFASCLVDPAMKLSASLRMTGLQILNTALTTKHRNEKGTSALLADSEIRDFLLRDVSISVLRTLGLASEASVVIAQAFTVVNNLLVVLGPYGLPLLETLLLRVFPSYVDGSSGNLPVTVQNREVGLEALACLMSQPGLLSMGFAAIDCDPVKEDAVGPLAEKLGKAVENSMTEQDRLIQSGPDAVDDADEIWNEIIAPGFLCADALLSLTDWLEERVNRNRSTEESTAYTKQIMESKRHKDESAKAAAAINKLGSKADGRRVLNLLTEYKIFEDELMAVKGSDLDRLIPPAAEYFRVTPSLDKSVIGTVLGEPDEISRKFLQNYTNSFDFTDNDITTALRIYLESFRLPGEAQKIDRIMHSFANRYMLQNESKTELKNTDVAYVVAFAIVMLNTDQHNDSIKKKMSLEDFVRNNRGMNDTEDFSKEFLLEIFESINALEIKMSNESGIDELNEILWEKMLQSAGYVSAGSNRSMTETRFLPESPQAPDSELFNLSWAPIVSSAKMVLAVGTNENEVQRAIDGFLRVARCSASLHTDQAIDECVAALSEASGLCSSPLYGAAVRFGVDVRAQLSFVALSGIVRNCGDGVRENGWSLFLSCATRLQCLGLLSSPAFDEMSGYGPELVDLASMPIAVSRLQPDWWPSRISALEKDNGSKPIAVRRNRNDPSNSFWALLGVGNNAVPESDNPYRFAPEYLICRNSAEEEARNLAQKSVEACRLDEILVTESRILQDESLAAYASAIRTSALTLLRHKADTRFRGSGIVSILEPIEDAEDDTEVAKYSALSFLMDLLTELTLRNRTRVGLVWTHFREVTQWLLADSSSTTVVTERAAVALLRVSVRLLHQDDVRDDVLRGLNLLLKLDQDNFATLALPVAAGVLHCIRTHSSQIRKPSAWHTLLSIIELLQRFPSPCLELGFESLRFLLLDAVEVSAVALETFSPFIDAVLAYALSTSSTATASLELFYALAEKVPSVQRGYSEDSPRKEDNSRWAELWKPLLQAIAQVVLQSAEWEIRLHALAVVERLSAAQDGERALTSAEYRLAIENVVLPMVATVFDTTKANSTAEFSFKIRQKAVTLVLKTFLQHHVGLYNDLTREQFAQLWLTILEGTAGNLDNASDGVAEYFNESLKNLLLVMETNEVLTRSDTVLWEKTATSIKKWLPSLYEEKFMDTEPDKLIQEVPDAQLLPVEEDEQVPVADEPKGPENGSSSASLPE
ncbi:hypothetical protein NDN08_003972 [Rhodosorus marinus]|uniref:SEC7 domain-containing protein n=1 Tax=Rhodosorus marinus TaxID=101924 RepID=A0AAV8UMA7_9RHOD|nr:hypothetical protein NDN08_003972 [Rhodosorus marinus]